MPHPANEPSRGGDDLASIRCRTMTSTAATNRPNIPKDTLIRLSCSPSTINNEPGIPYMSAT
ncbi:hypothetical protein HD593_009491 [Nonomuraea rubra]|uniref:Uncharacterized protein n=1 Tax=Nonomuraea rubra TaxID=46180 RepID=A0A7X0P3P1_9ACTN|nr:hypothetical protein [Nonomuraea rubra]